MPATTTRQDFSGHSGARLSARLDLPNGAVRAYALFAHCFTCSKDLVAIRRITAELAREGIAVLRFDFTGLGSSEGEFASTNFTSNVGDLVSAADHLRTHYAAPAVLIGHSLGGSAVLAAAAQIPEAQAVVTIGAPADAAHVLESFGESLDKIERDGQADVRLAGRTFTLQRHFVEDLRVQTLAAAIRALKRPLLVLHAPRDETVGIENATAIFTAARHPKSFVSLDDADHLLTRPADATFAGRVITGWLSKYIAADTPQGEAAVEHVRVTETGAGKFQNAVQAGAHRIFADEPASVGGLDSGPSPYDFLSIALGACTTMTLRLYAEHKKLELGRLSVDVSHAKIHARDCTECTDEERGRAGKIDRFERVISVEGGVPPGLRDKLLEIADKCPVHRTLHAGARVATLIGGDMAGQDGDEHLA